MNASLLPRARCSGRNLAATARVAPVLRPAAMRVLLSLLLFVGLTPRASALDIPPAPAQWYNDPASLLDPSQADALNAKLRDFEQKSGAQVLFYVFPSLEGEALEDFTIRCAEKWKVGNKKYDNGLILFVFKQEKKLRIEVGYGLEPTVTDSFSSDVIRNDIAPHFK
ncbi:MAG: TPM domain-containing protein, partial [Acidobacteriota bacterium]